MPKGERMREQPYPAATQMRTLFEDYQSFGSSAKRRKLYHIADCGSMILCGAAPFRQAVAIEGIRTTATEITPSRKINRIGGLSFLTQELRKERIRYRIMPYHGNPWRQPS